MRRLISFLALSSVLVACADQDADIEEAKYLLGKGGVENATKANSILYPLTLSGRTSGVRRLEVIRLYVGAQIGMAGFDSIKIVSALIYHDDDKLINAISAACAGISSDAATKLAAARNALADLFDDSDFTTAPERMQTGLYFQDALVDVLDSLRILVKVSGLSAGSLAAECTTNLNVNEIDSIDNTSKTRAAYSNSKLTNASATLQSATKARLSAQNGFVEAVEEIRTQTADVAAACAYLTNQQ